MYMYMYMLHMHMHMYMYMYMYMHMYMFMHHGPGSKISLIIVCERTLAATWVFVPMSESVVSVSSTAVAERQYAEAAEAAMLAAQAIDQTATFGIEEGEVDQLERKWITWSYDVEENKRLVLDEVDEVGLTPQRLSVWDSGSPRGGGSRARRRTPWGERLVASSPVYYGWVIAILVAVAALIVSPVQVFCVGVVIDFMMEDQGFDRVHVSGLYATATRIAITHP